MIIWSNIGGKWPQRCLKTFFNVYMTFRIFPFLTPEALAIVAVIEFSGFGIIASLLRLISSAS